MQVQKSENNIETRILNFRAFLDFNQTNLFEHD